MSAASTDKAAAAVESVDALKTRGNALFSKGDSKGAIVVYSEALSQLGESPRRGELAGSLLQNRALCYLKQKKFKECVADCDEALATAVRPKALYRRAAAREALGEEQEAFKDLKQCVAVDPKNLEAVKAARRLREVLSKQCEERGAFGSPAVGMATRITALNERYEDDRGSTTELFAAAAHRAADDPSEAAVFWRSKAADVALEAAGNEKIGESAFRFVSALASQGWFTEKPSAMAQVADLLTKKTAYFLEKPRTQITVLALAARLADANDSTDTANPALMHVVSAALRSENSTVRDGALDVLVRWLAPDDTQASTKKKKKGIKGMMEAVSGDFKEQRETRAREATEKESRRKARFARLDEALLGMEIEERGEHILSSWWSLLDSAIEPERRKAQAAVARLIRAVAPRKPTEEEGSNLTWEGEVARFCEALFVVNSCEDRALRRRSASLMVAAHLAQADMAPLAMMSCSTNVLELVQLVTTTKEALSESIGAEAIAALASSEAGRGSLAPLVEQGILEKLMQDSASSKQVRSAAASAIAKLGLAAKALKAGATETGRLLDASINLLRSSSGDDNEETNTTEERAVEILAAMCGASAVKEELAHGSGRCGEALTELTKVALRSKPGAPAGFALATIFASVTVTTEELRKRHFAEREMEITTEQYDELQRITKQKAEDDADMDTDDLCAQRCRKLVVADGVVALAHLTGNSPSPETAEKISSTLCALAKDEALRGTLIQQGGFKALLALARETLQLDSEKKLTEKGRIMATQGLAKILVTTNPNNLRDAQRLDAIAPLLWLAGEHKAPDLCHFEACLALTNLLSLGETARGRVAKSRGIRTIEYLQFSENEMVQRAATEALCNMVPNEDFLEHLRKKDKLKLWLALATDFERDVALARAAVGCLAMACPEPEISLLLVRDNNGAERLAEIIDSEEPSLVHRAAYAIGHIARDPEARPHLLEIKTSDNSTTMVAEALERAQKFHSNNTNEPLLNSIKDAILALKTEPPPIEEEDDNATTTTNED